MSTNPLPRGARVGPSRRRDSGARPFAITVTGFGVVRRPARASLLLVAVLATILTPAAMAIPDACAASSPHAALVVDKGADVERYCVQFPAGEDAVTGAELIQLAGAQHGLSYRFEQFDEGLAVCMLAGVGLPAGECLGTPY
ncbi:MAG: hypothetical protein H0U16_13195, partial [Actinobacteria bacterium]|nr:hypothetical protein [Actinomycetota bacterium]